MIAGFDKGVEGMKVGQTKTISIPADQAYGQRRDDLIVTFPISDVPNADELEEGQEVYLSYGMSAVITKKTDKEITIDANPKLAGKDLIFDITIKSINS
ncbi:MAG: FKBP-type peptidyl-prolyl cis-trans isomerase [Patescibacteria group bacterium]|nr:FKBP-type peptidyl-prolyl cis-trans isomerase [Patescibacteria group bacterium]